eukprot:9381524-Pyramimonas_sp.AAC.1
MVKRELAVRAARNVLQDEFPNEKFFVDRDLGEVSCNWRPLIRVAPTSATEAPIIQWSTANLAAEG